MQTFKVWFALSLLIVMGTGIVLTVINWLAGL